MSAAPESRSLRDARPSIRSSRTLRRADIDDYTVVGHPNGGYLQCLLANAALAAASDEGSAHVHTTAITTNYVTARTSVRWNCTPKCDEWVGASRSFTSNSSKTKRSRPSHWSPWALSPTTPRFVTASTNYRRWPSRGVPTAYGGRGDQAHERGRFSFGPTCAMWLDGERSDLAEVKGWLRLNDGVGRGRVDPALRERRLPPHLSTWFLGVGADLQLTSYVTKYRTVNGCERASGAWSSPTVWWRNAANCSTTVINSWPRRVSWRWSDFRRAPNEFATRLEDGSLFIRNRLTIPSDEIVLRVTTSGGPGVSTRMITDARRGVLRRERVPVLSNADRELLLEKLGPVVRASAGRFRSQDRIAVPRSNSWPRRSPLR